MLLPHRPGVFVGKRLIAFLLMFATLILGGTAAVLIVFGAPLGSAIAGHTPFAGAAFTIVWTVLRWLFTIVFITLLFSVFYYFGPNRETPKWQWVSPGGPSPLSYSWPRRWASRSMWPSSATTARPTAPSLG